MKHLPLLALLCFASVAVDAKLTGLQTNLQYTDADYVRNLADASTWIDTPGGNVAYFNLSTTPALADQGIAFSLAMLAPCGMILPHLHPRATKGIYLINGNVTVGWIQENKANVVMNTLVSGMATFIPRGAIHFVLNNDCTQSNQLDAYNYEDPGLLTLALNMFRWPDVAPETAMGINEATADMLRDGVPQFPLFPNQECLQRCGLASSSTTSSSSGACRLSFSTSQSNSWNNGQSQYTQYSVTLSNIGASTITSLSLTPASTQANITDFYSVTKSGSTYNLMSYGLPLAAGASYTFGYTVTGSTAVQFNYSC